MPFINQNPKFFNRSKVLALKENQIGVYGLFNSQRWIYVGKGDIRKRLLDHLRGDNPLILKAVLSHFVGEVTDQDPSRREVELIEELKPICNKRIG